MLIRLVLAESTKCQKRADTRRADGRWQKEKTHSVSRRAFGDCAPDNVKMRIRNSAEKIHQWRFYFVFCVCAMQSYLLPSAAYLHEHSQMLLYTKIYVLLIFQDCNQVLQSGKCVYIEAYIGVVTGRFSVCLSHKLFVIVVWYSRAVHFFLFVHHQLYT